MLSWELLDNSITIENSSSRKSSEEVKANQTNINLFSIENCFFLPFTSFQFQFLSRFRLLSKGTTRLLLLPFIAIFGCCCLRFCWQIYKFVYFWLCLNNSHAFAQNLYTAPSAERAIENLRSCNKSCMICVYTIPRNLRQIFEIKCLSRLCVCYLLLCKYVDSICTTTRELRERKSRRWWWKALCKGGENPLTIAHD